MKIIDIILLILLLVGAYDGFKKGLLVEIIAFLALIIGILTSLKLVHTGISYLDLDKESRTVYFIVFLLIFLLVFVGIFILGKFLKSILDYSLIGQLDDWVGALFGALKVAFGLSLILWLMNYSNINFPRSITSDTYIYPYLTHFAPSTIKWVSYVIPFQDLFPTIQKAMNE